MIMTDKIKVNFLLLNVMILSWIIYNNLYIFSPFPFFSDLHVDSTLYSRKRVNLLIYLANIIILSQKYFLQTWTRKIKPQVICYILVAS